MTKDEALKMAIEALETADAIVWEFGGVAYEKLQEALKICKEALEPEPMTTTDVITCKMTGKCCMTGEVLEQPLTRDWKHTLDERIARDSEFKEALEQPAQEPVAWYWDNHHRDKIPYVGVERGNPKMDAIFGTPIPLYTHPKQWQGLSDEERYLNEGRSPEEIEYARAIEAKLKEKNNGT